MRELQHLAELIRTRNTIGEEIAALIGRPALIGHVGEFIASKVFRIRLQESASHKGMDGRFRDGPLVGQSVNIKWYSKREGLLDINPDGLPDYFLVMTGPKSGDGTSRGGIRPWRIESVFLFDAQALVRQVQKRGVKIGIGTSVIQEQWRQAEIYPTARNPALVLSSEQRRQLALFR